MADTETEDRMINVTIFDAEEGDGPDWPPRDLVGAIEWLQAKLDLIPEVYRDGAVLEMRGGVDRHDNGYVGIEIHYERPETDADVEARRAAAEEDLREREIVERWTLAALQAKYGDR